MHRWQRRLLQTNRWSSYNIPCSIKIVHLCLIWCRVARSRDVHPCYMVSRCPCSLAMSTPPLLSGGAALSGLAMSTLAAWSRIVQSRDVSPHNFDGLAMSVLAISASPFLFFTRSLLNVFIVSFWLFSDYNWAKLHVTGTPTVNQSFFSGQLGVTFAVTPQCSIKGWPNLPLYWPK